MVDHPMKIKPIPGTLATNDGYVLCMVEQVTAAAVADDATLSFDNTDDVIPVRILSEKGSIIDFDNSVASSTSWVLTVNTTVVTTGTAATWVKGLALVKRID